LGGRLSTRLALTFTLALPFAAAFALASNGECGVSNLRILLRPPSFVIIVPFGLLGEASFLLSEGKSWLGKASGSCH
jgi:hypothetical protein